MSLRSLFVFPSIRACKRNLERRLTSHNHHENDKDFLVVSTWSDISKAHGRQTTQSEIQGGDISNRQAGSTGQI